MFCVFVLPLCFFAVCASFFPPLCIHYLENVTVAQAAVDP